MNTNMKTSSKVNNSNTQKTLRTLGLTESIQNQVAFPLDIERMKLLPAFAEVTYDGIEIGQIRKAVINVYFHPYQANITDLEISKLLAFHKLSA